MPVLAFTTVAVFLERPGRSEVQGFFDRSPATMVSTGKFDGHIPGSARIYIHPDTPPYPVEERGHPLFYQPGQHAGIGCTVSLWRSLESVFAFAYSGRHAEALTHRKEWFLPGSWPTYAAWWVDDGHAPSFTEAADRLDHLHAHGSSAFAFNFKAPFDATGAGTAVDRERAKQLMPPAKQ